jgi:zinc/manganese transport system ATP-binding protein
MTQAAAMIEHDRPILKLDQVALTIGGHQVLRNVSFNVGPGEFLGVIGTNGAGKTTLLRLILGLIRPTAGSVTVFGAAARHGNPAVGYVPQKQQFDPETPLRARDLVSLGIDGQRWGIALPNAGRRRKVDAALKAVGAMEYADAPIGRISGGEQQRLMIAQALLANPRLLLLDEPLANLDLRSANEIVSLVSRIGREQNVAIMLVAHDMNPLLQAMDRVVYLAEGRSAIGPVADVVQPEVLTQLYGYPVDVLHVHGRILVVAGGEIMGGGQLEPDHHACS